MTKSKQKFILTILFAIVLILFYGSFCLAQRPPEIEYPEIPGVEAPTATTTLAGYIKYIFNFSIIIGGILALAVLVFGGFLYLTSAGSPTAISEAKSRILAGISGLVLLLCSYLILTTINPELVIFKEMKPLEPVTGVCLCKTLLLSSCDVPCSGDEKLYLPDSDNGLKIKDFEATSVRFFNSPDDLTSVFIFKNKDYKASASAEIKEIKNPGAGKVVSLTSAPLLPPFFPPKSIFFLKNKPGVYLYEKTNFEIDKRPPLYLSGSTANLGEWNKKTQSILIKHPSEKIIKGAVLFTDQGFEGKCGNILEWPPETITNRTTLTPDLSTGAGWDKPYFSAIGNNELSSLYVFTIDTSKEYPGNVTFYDQEGCKENEIIIEPTLGALTDNFSNYQFGTESADKRVISFRINGSYKVILMTRPLPDPPYNAPAGLKCQGEWKLDETGCVGSIKGSTVYSPINVENRVSAYLIITAE